MPLPEKISPCPIKDALVEIRFNASVPPSAVFGILYNAIRDKFQKVENLPILQIPDNVRSVDPNLKHKPHYRLSNEQTVVQIGPDVLSISSYPEYLGWAKFSEDILEILRKVESLNVITEVTRLGLRYINFFPENIFPKIRFEVKMAEEQINYRNTVIRTEIEHESFLSTLQISNNASLNNESGSIIDIDTFKVNDLKNFFSIVEDLLNRGHEEEKTLFFSLLKESELKKLNPQY